MAGALLYQKVITKLQQQGASRDSEFPEISLLNYPFSEMLTGDINNSQVRNELLAALAQVGRFSDYVYIACQTLHGFLQTNELTDCKVVSLLDLTKQALAATQQAVVVVASKTSREFNLHPKYLECECEYVECDQSEAAIDAILAGIDTPINWLEDLARDKAVILGCTEFSVATQHSKSKFVDPIELAAEDIVSKFTEN